MGYNKKILDLTLLIAKGDNCYLTQTLCAIQALKVHLSAPATVVLLPAGKSCGYIGDGPAKGVITIVAKYSLGRRVQLEDIPLSI